MKQIILITGLTLLSFSIVTAQTMSNGGVTRRQNLQKSNVLRKKANLHSNNTYHVNKSHRNDSVPAHQLTDNAPRTQPMVTKPLIPPQ